MRAEFGWGISYLEKLGFLQRISNMPSNISVNLIKDSNNVESRILESLREISQTIRVIDFCQKHDLYPDELIEELTDLQSDGDLRYAGAEDTMLIELFHGSKLFEHMSEDKVGEKQYIQNKRYQLDQMILYAKTGSCRGRLVREYFGERVDNDYRCNLCDICDPSLLDAYNSLIERSYQRWRSERITAVGSLHGPPGRRGIPDKSGIQSDLPRSTQFLPYPRRRGILPRLNPQHIIQRRKP